MKAKEVLLWSIAFPGFGHILNKRYLIGFGLIILEFLINVKGHINTVIVSSFQGEIGLAIEQADYQWLMFYPCIYIFAIWDAFKDAGGGKAPYSFLPFVFAAYFMTLGVVYSSKIKLFGTLLGPVWLPILSVLPGLAVGFLIKWIVRRSAG